MAPAALSSASDDGGGLECAQDRAPLSWTNKRADTLSVCGLGRKAAASSAIRASGASNQTLREQLETGNQPDVVAVGVAGIPAADVSASTASCARGALGAEPSTSVT